MPTIFCKSMCISWYFGAVQKINIYNFLTNISIRKLYGTYYITEMGGVCEFQLLYYGLLPYHRKLFVNLQCITGICLLMLLQTGSLTACNNNTNAIHYQSTIRAVRAIFETFVGKFARQICSLRFGDFLGSFQNIILGRNYSTSYFLGKVLGK